MVIDLEVPVRDVSTFMTWFIQQLWNLITYVYATMDNITFMGTNMLDVLVTITILSVIIPILLTISKNNIRVGSARNEGKSK